MESTDNHQIELFDKLKLANAFILSVKSSDEIFNNSINSNLKFICQRRNEIIKFAKQDGNIFIPAQEEFDYVNKQIIQILGL